PIGDFYLVILSALPIAESIANNAVANTIAVTTVAMASRTPSSPNFFHVQEDMIAAGTAQQRIAIT
ncbi:MAG: hypothetical protein ACKO1K_04805, partial [Burkholderiales bacterium]